MTMKEAKLYIEKNKDRFLNELFEVLRIPSVSAQSAHREDMVRCAEHLAAALVEAGADRAEVMPTAGNPVVYGEKIVDPAAKTVLVYGHYDVMPVEPVGEWLTDPFEPVVKEGRIWGRGADDDKGQLFMHIKAFEAMCATDSLPCNVKFMLEGEEEIGSEHLYAFCEENRELLAADIILVSDTSMIGMDTPSITCGLRGLTYMEVEVTGPNKDLHSGLFGGAVANPANVLARLLASLVDERGRITIPGFYDDVRELTPAEREAFNRAPFSLEEYKQALEIGDVEGEAGYGAYGRSPFARRQRHLGRLYRRRHQDGDSVDRLGEGVDASGPRSGLEEDRRALRGAFQGDCPREREGRGARPARRHALRIADRPARLSGGRTGYRGEFRQEAAALLFGRLDSGRQRFRVDSGAEVHPDGLRAGGGCHPLPEREFRPRPVLQGHRDPAALL